MTAVNPLCADDLCDHCDDTALDVEADEFVQCECSCHAFERRREMERQEDGW